MTAGGSVLRGALASSAALAIALIAAACSDCAAEAPRARRRPPDELRDAGAIPAIARSGTGSDAARIDAGRPPRRIVPAIQPDTAFGGTEPAKARRLVYRVTLEVPRVLGQAPQALAPPVGELYLDVAADRLRARFAGQGWPIDAGSEVRLRRDLGGVYVFDAEGGRPLAPGQLASWFDGGRGRGSRAPVRIRVESAEAEGQGELVCALLAEWARQKRDGVMRRCADRSPVGFRVGPWVAERTADVPVELPEESLRADEGTPPDELFEVDSRAFLAPPMLARVAPIRAAPPLRGPPSPDGPGEGLRVTNPQPTRLVITVEGVPIGFVDAGATAHFVGLGPGIYRVGAMRPLGGVAARTRPVTVPADLSL